MAWRTYMHSQQTSVLFGVFVYRLFLMSGAVELGRELCLSQVQFSPISRSTNH
jgi:hypothetical protein